MIVLIEKDKHFKNHYIENIEDVGFKVYPTLKEFKIFIEYNTDEYMTFEFKIIEKGKITEHDIFDKIEKFIKFDNEYKNTVAYNPIILKDSIKYIADKLNLEFEEVEIPYLSFKYFKFECIIKKDNVLKINYKDQVGNILSINTKDNKVYKAYSDKLACIDHETFIADKLEGISIVNIYKLYGI